MITITIETNNAAFDDDYEMEVARILKSAAVRSMLGRGGSLPLRDINGNTVGHFADDEEA